MTAEVWEIISQDLNPVIMNFVTIIIHMSLMELVCGRKRPRYVMLGYAFVRSFLVRMLVFDVLRYFYSEQGWYQNLLTVTVLVNAVGLYVLLYYTYRGSYLKVALAGMGCECLAGACFTAAVLLFNMLYGESVANINTLGGAFEIRNLLAPVFEIGIFIVAVHFLGRRIKKLRMWEPKHRSLMWAVFLTYIAINIWSIFAGIGTLFISYLLGFFCISLLCAILFEKYRKRILFDNERLHLQKKLAEEYYFKINAQIRKMQKNQAIIDRQMKVIESMDAGVLESGKIAEYLKELKTQYQEVAAGVYCDDWNVDALLCQKADYCRRNGIQNDFLFQGYVRGETDNGEFVMLLRELLDTACYRSRETGSVSPVIRLHATVLKNQTVVKFNCEGISGEGIAPRNFRRWTKKGQGSVDITKSSGGYEILLTLQRK